MPDRLSLFDWYLARLRKRVAQESQTGNLTPLALVGSDKSLLEELVSQVSASRSASFNALQKRFEQNDSGVRRWLKALIYLAIASALILAWNLYGI